MDCYKNCPLKKRPVNYNLNSYINMEPENLKMMPEDLSLKRKSTDPFDCGESKRVRHRLSTEHSDHFNNPANWNSSFGHIEKEHRSISPSTDSCASIEYYRETSLSPPAVHASLQSIHLRGLTQCQQARADEYVHQHHFWELPANQYQDAVYHYENSNEPQDLSMKSCIPLPALYHGFEDNKHSSHEKSKQYHPRFSCDRCGKSYTTFSGLSKHQQFHCPAAECNQVKRFFNCEHCDKSYTTSGALKMHIRTHTLPCKCPTCGKAFSRPWLLQGHIRTHTGEKPFKCQYCSRAFADRSNLRAHLQTHAEVKKYVCSSCKKSFSRMSLLAKHAEGGCIPLSASSVGPIAAGGSLMMAQGPVYVI